MNIKSTNQTFFIKTIIILFFLIALLFFNFKNKGKEYYLNNSLEGYKKSRFINEKFVDSFYVKKIGFFNTHQDSIQFFLLLDEYSSNKIVEKYSLGLYVYLDESKLNENEDFKDFRFKPKIIKHGNNKYITETIFLNSKKMDSLIFFIYDRDVYRKMIGNRVFVRNLAI